MPDLLVDAYNVIRCDPELALLEQRGHMAAREALTRLLSGQSLRDYSVCVVFDGALPRDAAPPGRSGGRIQIVYAGPGGADARILREGAARAATGDCVVASNDSELRREAKMAGCGLWSVDDLLSRARGRKTRGIKRHSRPSNSGSPSGKPSGPGPGSGPGRWSPCLDCKWNPDRRPDGWAYCDECASAGGPINYRPGGVR